MTGGPTARRLSDARPGAPSDWLRVSWLVETSRRVYTHWGGESLRALLAAPGAIVWQQGRALRGALLIDPRRGEVGEARLLVVHDDADLMRFGAEVLPLAERRLAHRGMRWLSVSSPDDWLLELLTSHGYALKDRVITYSRRGWGLEARGNPDVVVESALPEDLPGMLAIDSAAFEPFWRLDRETMRRALDEDAYVLVARWRTPLPNPPPGYGEREMPPARGGAPPPSPPPGYGEREQSRPGAPGPLPGTPGGGYRRGVSSRRVAATLLNPPPEHGERGRGAVIGYLVADIWEERAHIVRLAVAPEHQRRGVATRLVAELFRRMGGEDTAAPTSRRSNSDLREVREVTLNTQETNARSRLLYERLGFYETGGVEEVWARELQPRTSAD